MCGIAGVISPTEAAARSTLPAMTGAIRHRGPDDDGLEYAPFGAAATLALGHRRLSIIDLSCAGHQPMTHPRTGDWLIFNGEIYNFATLRAELEAAGEQFVGHSDTEVLLHALAKHGPDVIRRLHGMFAFAWFDRTNERLVLARDAVGMKPLYLARAADGALLFASEVRALLASGVVSKTIDRAGLAGMLAYGCVQHPLTMFEAVKSFPAGHYQIIDARSWQRPSPPVPFWDYPPPQATTEADVIPRVRKVLEDSVEAHLMSDVPVGVFLSSGLDSTIVAALAAKRHPRMRSFTVAFADQPDLSEGALAAESAAAFGLDHTEVQVTAAECQSAAAQWLAALDQPSIDGLNVFVISQAIRRHGIIVALAGNGGDELFGGYPTFTDVARLRRAFRRIRFLPRPARQALAAAIAVRHNTAVRQKLVDIAGTHPELLDLYLQRRRAMSNRQLAELGLHADALGLHPSFEPPAALADLRTDASDPVWTVSQLETRFYQHNMLLRDGDANSMAHSLEVRFPFLDRPVLDLAFTIPGNVRLPNGRPDKHLLRGAFADLLRPALMNQRKMGFTLPIRRWMLGALRGRCETSIRYLKSSGLLRPDGVDAVWNAFLAEPESPVWTRAFALAVLGSYLSDLKAS